MNHRQIIATPWTIIRDYFAELTAQPGETLEARIQRQVSQIKGQAFSVADRVAVLEAKSQNMDVYYLKTIGTVLKSHYDAKLDFIKGELNARSAKHEGNLASLHEQIDLTNAELAKVNSRLTSFIRKFRQLGESNE